MAALITAGTAGAGSVDDAFIAQLDNDGITPPSAAVAETTGMSVKGSKVFALDAAQAYCPQYVTSSWGALVFYAPRRTDDSASASARL